MTIAQANKYGSKKTLKQPTEDAAKLTKQEVLSELRAKLWNLKCPTATQCTQDRVMKVAIQIVERLEEND